jgi:hypothetical protein
MRNYQRWSEIYWRKLHYEEINDEYSAPNLGGWRGESNKEVSMVHLAYNGEREIRSKFLIGKMWMNMGHLRMQEQTQLIVEKRIVKDWTRFGWLMLGSDCWVFCTRLWKAEFHNSREVLTIRWQGQSPIPQRRAQVEFCAGRNWITVGDIYIYIYIYIYICLYKRVQFKSEMWQARVW